MTALSELEYVAMEAEAARLHKCSPAFRTELVRRNGVKVGTAIALRYELPKNKERLRRDLMLPRSRELRAQGVPRSERVRILTDEFSWCHGLNVEEQAKRAVNRVD